MVPRGSQSGGAFYVLVALMKPFVDIVSGEVGFGRTWQSSSVGLYSSGADFIVQALSEHMDRFILEYLRVNEDACER